MGKDIKKENKVLELENKVLVIENIDLGKGNIELENIQDGLRIANKNLTVTNADQKEKNEKGLKKIEEGKAGLVKILVEKKIVEDGITQLENKARQREAVLRDKEIDVDIQSQKVNVLKTDYEAKIARTTAMNKEVDGLKRDAAKKRVELDTGLERVNVLESEAAIAKDKAKSSIESAEIKLKEAEDTRKTVIVEIATTRELKDSYADKHRKIDEISSRLIQKLADADLDKESFNRKKAEFDKVIKAQNARQVQQNLKDAAYLSKDKEIERREKDVELLELRVRKIIKEKDIDAEIKKLKADLDD